MEKFTYKVKEGGNGRFPLLFISLLITALLTACGGSPIASPDSPTNQENGTASGSNSAAAPDSAPAGEGSPTTSPDSVLGTEEYGLTREGLVTSIETVEALIANCMSEAGFEYIAADYNTVRQGMVADKSLPGLSEKGYFDQYGYGISTLYTGLPPQLAAETTPAQIGLGQQNLQIFKNLPPADQVAYNHTLLGENTNVTFAVAIETEDLSRTGGCTRAAIEQVFTPEQLTTTYVNPKDALIEQDPRMVEAVAQYAKCIRAAGFDYNHEREIEADLRNRLAQITEGLPLEALSADARAALQELQTYERALAVASYDCEEKYLEPAEDKVERELFAGRQQ